MKKIVFAFCGFAGSISAWAQEPADALRYSWVVPGATARVMAIGGANGSLGGDISSTFINPAGLAFYRTGDFVFTPGYNLNKTKGTFYNHTEDDKKSQLSIGTTGFVIGSGTNGRGVRNMAFSLGINRMADFNSNILYRGQNSQSSISQKYVEELNNSGVKNSSDAEYNYPFGASLFYNTHWIDSVSNGAGQIDRFVSNAPVGSGLNQQNIVNNRGGITEFAFGLAANLNNKFMLGGTFGVPVLNYKRDGEFVEADATDDPNNAFNYGIFSEKLHTQGVGINLKAGVIYKPAEFWRLGLAFHTPTVFSLTDNYETHVTLNDDVPDNLSWNDDSKNYTGNAPSEFKYYLITPYKVMGSISYVLREVEDVTKQRGFLTADVEYVNYASAAFQPDSENGNDLSTKDYLKSLNTAIDKAYKSAINVRAGGELKFTTIMVRAGVAYYGSPYQNIAGENGSKLNLSGGLGYRNKGFFIDLTYVHSMQKDVHFPYRLQYGPYAGANLKTTAGNALLTVGFKI
ncbi:MAG: OmpP1/FadL family transporter [Flavisolibacter sp.]